MLSLAVPKARCQLLEWMQIIAGRYEARQGKLFESEFTRAFLLAEDAHDAIHIYVLSSMRGSSGQASDTFSSCGCCVRNAHHMQDRTKQLYRESHSSILG